METRSQAIKTRHSNKILKEDIKAIYIYIYIYIKLYGRIGSWLFLRVLLFIFCGCVCVYVNVCVCVCVFVYSPFAQAIRPYSRLHVLVYASTLLSFPSACKYSSARGRPRLRDKSTSRMSWLGVNVHSIFAIPSQLYVFYSIYSFNMFNVSTYYI